MFLYFKNDIIIYLIYFWNQLIIFPHIIKMWNDHILIKNNNLKTGILKKKENKFLMLHKIQELLKYNFQEFCDNYQILNFDIKIYLMYHNL